MKVSGLTLVEVLAAVVLLGVVAAAAAPLLRSLALGPEQVARERRIEAALDLGGEELLREVDQSGRSSLDEGRGWYLVLAEQAILPERQEVAADKAEAVLRYRRLLLEVEDASGQVLWRGVRLLSAPPRDKESTP